MSSRSTFNAFQKPVDGIKTKSTSGGFITILAYAIATILFLSQLYLYIQVDVRHSLSLAPSHPLSEVIPTEGGFSKKVLQAKGHKYKKQTKKGVYDALKFIEKNKIDIFVHVTFPSLKCSNLDFSHNGAFFSTGEFSKNHGYSKFSKRIPTEYDWAMATTTTAGGAKNVKGLSKKKNSSDPKASNACTVRGKIAVPRISGDITISMSAEAFAKIVNLIRSGMSIDQTDTQTGGHDLSHYIHDITFGTAFPLSQNPLSNKMVKINNPLKIALNHINAKLVPTKYKKFARRAKDTFQTSISNHLVTMDTLARTAPFTLPGLKIQYDFTPLAVSHVESRENFFVFLSSLIGIVGGVFVTVGAVSGFVVNSAQALKKVD